MHSGWRLVKRINVDLSLSINMLMGTGKVTRPEPVPLSNMDGPGRRTQLQFPAIRYASTSTISQEATLLTLH